MGRPIFALSRSMSRRRFIKSSLRKTADERRTCSVPLSKCTLSVHLSTASPIESNHACRARAASRPMSRLFSRSISSSIEPMACASFRFIAMSWKRGECTILYAKQSVIGGCSLHNLVEVFTVGIGNKYLSEDVACHKLHNALNTLGIQFVKKVIE